MKVDCLVRTSLMGVIGIKLGGFEKKVNAVSNDSFIIEDEVTCEGCGLVSLLRILEKKRGVKAPGELGLIDPLNAGGDNLYELKAAMTMPKVLTEVCVNHLG